MFTISNLITLPVTFLANWGAGCTALARLLGWAAAAAAGSDGTFRTRLTAQLLAVEGQRTIFTILRAFAPNLRLNRKIMAAYENTGTALVTRREDVLAVLSNDADFEVVYEPRMREITDGSNFFLGMQPSWDYARDTSALRLAMRATDVETVIRPRALALSTRAVAASQGRLDLVQDIGLVVSADLAGHYLGLPGPSRSTMIEWTTTLFWYLFADIGADAELGRKARAMMAPFRDYIDLEIACRKARGGPDDVLGRCLALQSAGMPGLSDEGIRNNLVGLAIGAVPTLSKATALVLEELLRRPDVLRKAQAAAAKGDTAALGNFCWEALRFNPHQPIIYRRAVRTTTISRAKMRAISIPKGTMVFAATLSAAFDRLAVDDPTAFRTDRQNDLYMTWGSGLHSCFGDAINRVVIPTILQPVLARGDIGWADGVNGIDTADTPFPAHMHIVIDRPSASISV